MGVGYNTKIVTNGLVMCLDAANSKSYPGTGTTWYDISGNGYNATLYNSPSFANGVFTFNGTNSYAAASSINLAVGNSTIVGASRYSGATRGRMIAGTNNNWLMGNYSNSVANYYAEGWVSTPGAGGTDTTWRIYAATGNTVGDSWEFFINGVSNASGAGGSAGPNGISIGCYANGVSEFSTGDCSFVLAYNRVLSAAEIKQNYNVCTD